MICERSHSAGTLPVLPQALSKGGHACYITYGEFLAHQSDYHGHTMTYHLGFSAIIWQESVKDIVTTQNKAVSLIHWHIADVVGAIMWLV